MSLFNRIPKDPATRANAVEQLLKQLLGEVQRIWKVMPPEYTGQPATGLSPVGDPFYTPDPGTSGGGSTTAEFDYCTLLAPLYRGTSASGTLASNGSTVAVWGDYFGGYGFDGDVFEVVYVTADAKWYARGAGSFYETGEVITVNSTGEIVTVEVRSNKWIESRATVVEAPGGAGMQAGISWDTGNQAWYLVALEDTSP